MAQNDTRKLNIPIGIQITVAVLSICGFMFTQFTPLRVDIGILKDNVSENTQAVAALESRFSTLDDRFDVLENKVDAIGNMTIVAYRNGELSEAELVAIWDRANSN